MKTMITRNNVPRHNGTMRCLLGRNGPWEFRAITPRRGADACGSCRETRKRVGSSGSQAEGPEDVRKLVEDQEGVGRGQEGPEEVGKAVGEGGRSGRTWESNGTLQVLEMRQGA